MRIVKRTDNRTKPKEENKINTIFDNVVLNLFCSFAISKNRSIRRNHLSNLNKLVCNLNMDNYLNDPDKYKKIVFIRRALEAKLEYNLTNIDIIKKHITEDLTGSEESLFDSNTLVEMSNSEVDWINTIVSDTLKYDNIYTKSEKYIDICTRVRTSDFSSKTEIIKEFESLLKSTMTDFRRMRNEKNGEASFSLRNGVFEDSIREIHSALSNPANKLPCGMQGMNIMTGGGFESGRVYMFFGLPGEGKSLTLLNLAYQLKKNNRNYKTKDPTKTPCIVLLTMENYVRETVERLFALISDNDHDITHYTPEEVMRIIRTEGELFLSDESPIDIIIKFVPDRSVDTSYLYTLSEDLEDDGYEVICLIQDYVKRIRSVNYTSDIRIELGWVVNEFKTFATQKDIPLITASQLNREASKHIDEGRKSNKGDLLRLLGRSNIGESMLMLENIDCGFMIAPEYDLDNRKYMGIQRIKIRYKASNVDHIYHPFSIGNELRFEEDSFLPVPLYKDSLVNENANSTFGGGNTSVYHTTTIKNLDEIDELDTCFSSQILSSSTNLKLTQAIIITKKEEPVLKQAIYFGVDGYGYKAFDRSAFRKFVA